MSAPISPEAEAIIGRAYVELKKPGASISAYLLLIKASAIVQEEGTDIRLPKLRKTGYILKDLINKDENRPDEQKALDNPWTVHSLIDNPIPPEALPHVLRVWEASISRDPGHPLTIREAKWVARLYTIFKNDDVEGLSEFAENRALHERIGELSKKPVETGYLNLLHGLSDTGIAYYHLAGRRISGNHLLATQVFALTVISKRNQHREGEITKEENEALEKLAQLTREELNSRLSAFFSAKEARMGDIVQERRR